MIIFFAYLVKYISQPIILDNRHIGMLPLQIYVNVLINAK